MVIKRFNRQAVVLTAVIMALLLSGCMYPKELRKENAVALKESVLIVQTAIQQYQQQTGVLPIKNFTESTPLYERYVIDFSKMIAKQTLSSIPATAYEKGGSAVFVLTNVEESPQVKLMDIASVQQINEVQKWVDDYRASRQGALPKGAQIAPSFYSIDFKALGQESQQVRSLYFTQLNSLIINEAGQVFVDYGSDIAQLIQKKGMPAPNPDTDLRQLLVDDGLYVPVKSTAYHWQNDQPVAIQPL
ncbi:hypothetical protein [Paenibacillus sp. y28]|uniref:hypothetical protein n=1 Tax=Paenibacillus sp. y28 TaxID=3129110 RepID=UPI003015B335